ncbi:MAG: hypothetical protein HKM04_03400 [Legionellales bacterium]|nr:hypothetical protein [Legionellales bacterium]
MPAEKKLFKQLISRMTAYLLLEKKPDVTNWAKLSMKDMEERANTMLKEGTGELKPEYLEMNNEKGNSELVEFGSLFQTLMNSDKNLNIMDCPDLVTALREFEKLHSDYLPLSPVDTQNPNTFFLSLNDFCALEPLFMQHLTTKKDKNNKINLSFDIDGARLAIAEWQQTRPIRQALTDLAPQVGLMEDFLANRLEKNVWLTDLDIERSLSFLDLKEKVGICRLNEADIATKLHFEREKHEKDKVKIKPYQINLILNVGSSDHSRIDDTGQHWVNLDVEVNPAENTVTCRYTDPLFLSESTKVKIEKMIRSAISYEKVSESNKIKKVYSAFPHAKIDVVINDTKEQTDSYTCGYRALKHIAEIEIKNGRPSEKLVALAACNEAADLTQNIYTLLLNGAELSEQEFNALNNEDIKKYFNKTITGKYNISNEDAAAIVYYLNETRDGNKKTKISLGKVNLEQAKADLKLSLEIASDPLIQKINSNTDEIFALDYKDIQKNTHPELFIRKIIESINKQKTIKKITLSNFHLVNNDTLEALKINLDFLSARFQIGVENTAISSELNLHIKNINVRNQYLQSQFEYKDKSGRNVKDKTIDRLSMREKRQKNRNGWDILFSSMLIDLPNKATNVLSIFNDQTKALGQVFLDKLFDYLSNHEAEVRRAGIAYTTLDLTGSDQSDNSIIDLLINQLNSDDSYIPFSSFEFSIHPTEDYAEKLNELITLSNAKNIDSLVLNFSHNTLTLELIEKLINDANLADSRWTTSLKIETDNKDIKNKIIELQNKLEKNKREKNLQNRIAQTNDVTTINRGKIPNTLGVIAQAITGKNFNPASLSSEISVQEQQQQQQQQQVQSVSTDDGLDDEGAVENETFIPFQNDEELVDASNIGLNNGPLGTFFADHNINIKPRDCWNRIVGHHASFFKYGIDSITVSAAKQLLKNIQNVQYGLIIDDLPAGFYIEQGEEIDEKKQLILCYDPINPRVNKNKSPLTLRFSEPTVAKKWNGDISQFISDNKKIDHLYTQYKTSIEKASLPDKKQKKIRNKTKNVLENANIPSNEECRLNYFHIKENINKPELTSFYHDLLNRVIEGGCPDSAKANEIIIKLNNLFKTDPLTNQNILAIMEILHSEGAPSLEKLLIELEAFKQKVEPSSFSHFKTHFLDPLENFNDLLTKESLSAIQDLGIVSKEKREWWEALSKQHSQGYAGKELENKPKLNFAELFEGFSYFCEEFNKLSGGHPLPIPCPLTGVADMRTGLARLLTILSNARDINEQISALQGLSLDNVGPYYASRYDGYKLVTKEMKLQLGYLTGNKQAEANNFTSNGNIFKLPKKVLLNLHTTLNKVNPGESPFSLSLLSTVQTTGDVEKHYFESILPPLFYRQLATFNYRAPWVNYQQILDFLKLEEVRVKSNTPAEIEKFLQIAHILLSLTMTCGTGRIGRNFSQDDIQQLHETLLAFYTNHEKNAKGQYNIFDQNELHQVLINFIDEFVKNNIQLTILEVNNILNSIINRQKNEMETNNGLLFYAQTNYLLNYMKCTVNMIDKRACIFSFLLLNKNKNAIYTNLFLEKLIRIETDLKNQNLDNEFNEKEKLVISSLAVILATISKNDFNLVEDDFSSYRQKLMLVFDKLEPEMQNYFLEILCSIDPDSTQLPTLENYNQLLEAMIQATEPFSKQSLLDLVRQQFPQGCEILMNKMEQPAPTSAGDIVSVIRQSLPTLRKIIAPFKFFIPKNIPFISELNKPDAEAAQILNENLVKMSNSEEFKPILNSQTDEVDAAKKKLDYIRKNGSEKIRLEHFDVEAFNLAQTNYDAVFPNSQSNIIYVYSQNDMKLFQINKEKSIIQEIDNFENVAIFLSSFEEKIQQLNKKDQKEIKRITGHEHNKINNEGEDNSNIANQAFAIIYPMLKGSLVKILLDDYSNTILRQINSSTMSKNSKNELITFFTHVMNSPDHNTPFTDLVLYHQNMIDTKLKVINTLIALQQQLSQDDFNKIMLCLNDPKNTPCIRSYSDKTLERIFTAFVDYTQQENTLPIALCETIFAVKPSSEKALNGMLNSILPLKTMPDEESEETDSIDHDDVFTEQERLSIMYAGLLNSIHSERKIDDFSAKLSQLKQINPVIFSSVLDLLIIMIPSDPTFSVETLSDCITRTNAIQDDSVKRGTIELLKKYPSCFGNIDEASNNLNSKQLNCLLSILIKAAKKDDHLIYVGNNNEPLPADIILSNQKSISVYIQNNIFLLTNEFLDQLDKVDLLYQQANFPNLEELYEGVFELFSAQKLKDLKQNAVVSDDDELNDDIINTETTYADYLADDKPTILNTTGNADLAATITAWETKFDKNPVNTKFKRDYSLSGLNDFLKKMRNINNDCTLTQTEVNLLKNWFCYINTIGHDHPICVNPMESDIDSVNYQFKTIENFSSVEIQRLIAYYRKKVLDSKLSEDEKTKIKLDYIALSREVMYRSTGKFPYPNQILYLLSSMLSEDNFAAQIKTGEGKTTIAALHASFLSFLNYSVDITSSNIALAKEGLEINRPFFERMGIPCNVITSQDSGMDAYDDNHSIPGIHYSTLPDLALYWAKMKIKGKKFHKNAAVIADEIDFQTLDDSSRYRFAKRLDPGSDPDVSPYDWIYSALIEFADRERNLPPMEESKYLEAAFEEIKRNATSKEKKEALAELKNKTNFNTRLKTWLIAAGKTYDLINEEGIKFKVVTLEHPRKGQISKACLLNNGRVNIEAEFCASIQQFLHCRLMRKYKDRIVDVDKLNENKTNIPQFLIEPEKIYITSSNSHMHLSQYQYKSGMSGTIGSRHEIFELMKKYAFRFVDIPRRLVSQRIDLNPILTKPKYLDNPVLEEQDHIQTIVNQLINHIKTCKKGKKYSPVLILCGDEAQGNKIASAFAAALENNPSLKEHHTAIQEYYSSQKPTSDERHAEEMAIKTNAAFDGLITISTVLGRGTDIEPKHIDGLFTIKTFIDTKKYSTEDLERSKEQAEGRSGRQSKRGKTQLIACRSELLPAYKGHEDKLKQLKSNKRDVKSAIEKLNSIRNDENRIEREKREKFDHVKHMVQTVFFQNYIMGLNKIKNTANAGCIEAIKSELFYALSLFYAEIDEFWMPISNNPEGIKLLTEMVSNQWSERINSFNAIIQDNNAKYNQTIELPYIAESAMTFDNIIATVTTEYSTQKPYVKKSEREVILDDFDTSKKVYIDNLRLYSPDVLANQKMGTLIKSVIDERLTPLYNFLHGKRDIANLNLCQSKVAGHLTSEQIGDLVRAYLYHSYQAKMDNLANDSADINYNKVINLILWSQNPELLNMLTNIHRQHYAAVMQNTNIDLAKRRLYLQQFNARQSKLFITIDELKQKILPKEPVKEQTEKEDKKADGIPTVAKKTSLEEFELIKTDALKFSLAKLHNDLISYQEGNLFTWVSAKRKTSARNIMKLIRDDADNVTLLSALNDIRQTIITDDKGRKIEKTLNGRLNHHIDTIRQTIFAHAKTSEISTLLVSELDDIDAVLNAFNEKIASSWLKEYLAKKNTSSSSEARYAAFLSLITQMKSAHITHPGSTSLLNYCIEKSHNLERLFKQKVSNPKSEQQPKLLMPENHLLLSQSVAEFSIAIMKKMTDTKFDVPPLKNTIKHASFFKTSQNKESSFSYREYDVKVTPTKLSSSPNIPPAFHKINNETFWRIILASIEKNLVEAAKRPLNTKFTMIKIDPVESKKDCFALNIDLSINGQSATLKLVFNLKNNTLSHEVTPQGYIPSALEIATF